MCLKSTKTIYVESIFSQYCHVHQQTLQNYQQEKVNILQVACVTNRKITCHTLKKIMVIFETKKGKKKKHLKIDSHHLQSSQEDCLRAFNLYHQSS